jgi:arylsulfatase A-like enzyme
LEAHYDEELCTLDFALSNLFRLLDRRGLLDRSWVFITSDHGEAFGEHALTEHGTSLYNDETRVPLIVFPPQGESFGSPGSGPVGLIDVAATIAEIGGAALPGSGRSLHQSGEAGRPIRIELYPDRPKARFFGARAAEPARAVVVGRYKLIEQGGRRELYDLISDPRETLDLSTLHVNLVRQLARSLPQLPMAVPPTKHEPALTREQEDQLKALGYIRGGRS